MTATSPQPDRVTAIYDAIDAFQRTHRTGGGLAHAQIRALLAEHLARALPAPSAAVSPPPATDRAAKAEALLLHFTAEAHRRKWSYDKGLDDDGVPLKSEAFDALHRLGDEMNVELHKLRRLVAGERDEQQAKQGDATILAELQQHLTDHTPSCNARTDHLMRRAAWALGMPRPAHVGGNAEDCPGCEGTNPPYPFICPQPEPAAAPVAGQPPADTGEEAQYGVDDCTCIPFTRQTDPPRYLNRPTDTVDMISGWEPGGDCPHHEKREARRG